MNVRVDIREHEPLADIMKEDFIILFNISLVTDGDHLGKKDQKAVPVLSGWKRSRLGITWKAFALVSRLSHPKDFDIFTNGMLQ